MSQIKRIAGASIGSVSAAMLSVGYTPDEMMMLQKINIKNILSGLALLYEMINFICSKVLSIYL